VLIHAQSVLGLVQDGLVGTAMDVLVLGAADLVAEGLSSGLLRIWASAAIILLDSCPFK
jgi:hypothetical protein